MPAKTCKKCLHATAEVVGHDNRLLLCVHPVNIEPHPVNPGDGMVCFEPRDSSDTSRPSDDTPRVDAIIGVAMKRSRGEGASAQARYYEKVHQHLALLARDLERDNNQMREALMRLREWGGHASQKYSAEIVLGVMDWIDGDMLGELPTLPDYAA